MSYSTFDPKGTNTLKEPMFLGENLTIARYDQLKYPLLDKLTEKQLGFFWTPSEIDLSKDRIDFQAMPDHEKHIFVSNLQYQILLDSVQGRAPNLAFLPLVSIPELETFIEVWSAFETIHSRSYTHIIRNVFNDPSVIFDEIETLEPIAKRAHSVTRYYDELIRMANMYSLGEKVDMYELKRLLYLTLVSVNVLEGIRFYVSFACSFSFAERKVMAGNASIIKMIARDEAVHLSATQFILNNIVKEDAQMAKIAQHNVQEVRDIFAEAAQQEIEWAKYLMKDGSTMGLNEQILVQYVKHLTNARMGAIGLSPLFEETKNPILWVNNWLTSDNVQVAPQEAEITSYLVGAIDNEVGDEDFDDFGEL